MAGAGDERVVDREPAGVRVGRPSRFGVVSLLVLLMVGCGLNLYVAHTKVLSGPKPRSVIRSYEDSAGSDARSMLPADLVKDGYRATMLEADIHWLYGWYGYGIIRKLETQSHSSRNDSTQNRTDMLFVERYGAPFMSRSSSFAVRALYAGDSTQSGGFDTTHAGPKGLEQIWPTPPKGNQLGPPSVTYHPLGLILNPIIYALPIWLLVMGIRWAFITRRCRRRERLGLCVGCAYELGELSVCPECGCEGA